MISCLFGRDKATKWTTGVQLPTGVMMGFFFFSTVSMPPLEPNEPHTQWVPVVKMPLPQYVFMAWCLAMHRGNFIFFISLRSRCSYESRRTANQFFSVTKLHGSDSVLRIWQSLSWSRNFQPFMEPEDHYRVHKSPPLFPILSQIHPVKTFPSMPRSSEWSLLFRFSNYNID